MDTSTGSKCTDCGNIFPLLASAAMCAKCLKLESLSMESAEYKEIMSRWLQCKMCGESFRNMQKSANSAVQVCGSTVCLNTASSNAHVSAIQTPMTDTSSAPLMGGTISAVPETHAARAFATRERLKLAVATAAINSVATGTSLTTATLMRQEQAPNSQQIIVCFKFRRGAVKSLDTKLGSGRHWFLKSDYIIDIKEHCLKSANAEWVKNGASPLRINEVSLRFSGNKNFDEGTNSLSIGEFVNFYSGPDKVGLCLETTSADFKDIRNPAKLTILCLELYIHTDIYENRVEMEEEEEYEEISHKKRCNRRTNSSSAGLPSKFSKSSNGSRNVSMTVGSMFRPSSRTDLMTVNKTTKIMFKKIICTLDASSSLPRFSEIDEVLSGHLQDKPFATGTMKCAFELIIRDGDGTINVCAAKRFFRLEDNTEDIDILALMSTPVDAEEHNIQIQAECARACQGKWFLSAFRQRCQHLDVAIDESIAFAEVFLIQEIGTPSPASGLNSDSTMGMIWLVERRRSTHVQRFSGTLSHRADRGDLCASTVYALAHFIYGHSKKAMVFADIQGTPAQVKGRDRLVLFDPMSHTVNGDSGIGDFGPEGIASFIRDHSCGKICRRLRLAKEIPLAAEDEEEDSNSDTDDE